jgi:hypothetical protein
VALDDPQCSVMCKLTQRPVTYQNLKLTHVFITSKHTTGLYFTENSNYPRNETEYNEVQE